MTDPNGRPIVQMADRLIARFGGAVGGWLTNLLLNPVRLDASSRAWAWYVNSFAASPLLRGRERQRAYQRAGMDVQTDWIGPACYFHTSLVSIGRGVQINHGCHIENVAPVELADDSAMAMYAMIFTSHHEIGGPERRHRGWEPRPVSVLRGAWIGARATVLPGVTVGEGCLIAAGAVVVEDCEPNGLYAGIPAKRIKDLPA
jgi:maltose O-acetyltransferase